MNLARSPSTTSAAMMSESRESDKEPAPTQPFRPKLSLFLWSQQLGPLLICGSAREHRARLRRASGPTSNPPTRLALSKTAAGELGIAFGH
ncbi:predicted protein [Coccidioides posadasii str. Silveira]|uniref:Predicted protein n=1 Tax=Coccidioides posadasii (strain RMSCC 757 / Silveira) TaxID=443226 RepID=E9DBR5_COCPS|nr:predicted protein [Coccidioides posadasii str. Silveira]